MKIKNILFSTVGVAAMVSGAINAHAIANTAATEAYGTTSVQPQIRLNLDKDTDTVHFIRDNTDPYVVTKAYRLKNADPYEIRPYLRDIFTANKIGDSPTRVECIKYNDGTSFVLVSAEEDRFGPQTDGMGIDELIASLDKEKLTSSSGSDRFLYFPQYRNATTLGTLIQHVGMDPSGSNQLVYGKDAISVDPELNAILFFIPKYSKKNIENMLKYYDQPILQIAVKYTVYEVYSENDGKLGVDFQNWKNNDGLDLLSVGGKYRNNWTATYSGGVVPGGGEDHTQYFSLNPKWNTKYLDLLTTIGKAKVMTSGEVVVKHGQAASITEQSQVFYSSKTATTDSSSLVSAYSLNVGADDYSSKNYTVAKDDSESIKYYGSNSTIYAVKYNSGGSIGKYILSATSGYFMKGTENVGRQTEATSLKSWSYTDSSGTDPITYTYAWTEDTDYALGTQKGPQVTTAATDSYGFTMTVTPAIGRNSTTLDVTVENQSLVGWNADGTPRLSDNSVETQVMIGNKGNRFAIGGVTKSEVVRSVSGVPYLREIPGLGWIFGSESESTKKSQLIVIAECVAKSVDAPLSEAATGTISEITSKTKDAGEGFNAWGFDQYLIDKPIK